MAHRTNVTQVHMNFDSQKPSEQVRDPACGKLIERRTARHVLFRPEVTHYFCSRECEQNFLNPPKTRKVA